MYMVSLIKSIVSRKKWGYIVFMLINILILGPISLGYFLTVIICGEYLIRLMMGCSSNRQLNREEIVDVAFADAYLKAKRECPHISENVKLYIYNSAEIEAYAYGRNTICISSGAVNLPRKELTTLFLQKFAQFAEHDSEMLLMLTIGNIAFIILTILGKICVYIIGIIMYAIMGVWRIIGNIFGIMKADSRDFIQGIIRFQDTFRIIKVVADGIEKIILFIVRVIMLIGVNSYKKSIYINDEFVCRCGLKNELLYYLMNIESDYIMNDSIFGIIEAMKPLRQDRISKVRSYDQQTVYFRVVNR